MQDLGTLGGSESLTPTGINNSGQVVGVSTGYRPSDYFDAFLYSNGSMQDLNSLITRWVWLDP